MATTEALTTKQDQGLVKILNDAMPELKRIAPKFVNVTRMVQLALEARKNPILAQSSPDSVLNFCMKCAQAGTDRIGAGGMWPVPFKNNKTGHFDMVPIPDWRLIIEKAKKAGAIKHAKPEVVYQNDVFDYERGLNPFLRHKPTRGERGKIVAVYCVYVLPDDTKDFEVMDWEQDVIPIRNNTNAWKSGQSNPWKTHEAEQGKKTVVKRAMKPFEGASIELTQIIALDNVVNGYADITVCEPEPIPMPRAITATATVQPDPPDLSPNPNPPSSGDEHLVTGVIEDVESKQGEKKDGTTWIKWGVKVKNVAYGTFDGKIAERAMELRTQKVNLVWREDGKYKTIVSLGPCEEPKDELPFAAKDLEN